VSRTRSGSVAKAICVASTFAMMAHCPLASAADDRVRIWVSPDQSVTLSSIKAEIGGYPVYQLRLTRLGQAPVVIDEYLRDVDVLWSADSKYVAVTDWIGSNVADCYVVDTLRPAKKMSVTATLPKLDEDIADSHFYVSCKNWLSLKTIAVEAAGHTDYSPFHDFTYHFVLDVETNQVRTH
jgi:hypothetical protein